MGQLVLVGGHGLFVKRGHYHLGRVSKVLPQIRKGKALQRRAIVAVNYTKGHCSALELTFIE